jgi:hypothetical protein
MPSSPAAGNPAVSPPAAALLALAIFLTPVAGADYESWSQVENAAETRDYGDALRTGSFEVTEQMFLDRVMLPQLELETNRASIAGVRRRICELALRNAKDPPIFDAVNSRILAYAEVLSNDTDRDPLLTVNAMLLVGELQGADRKPWPGSLPTLAKAAGNTDLPLAVRIAALAGLNRHADAGVVNDAFRKAVAPVLAQVLENPLEGDPAAVTWMRSRAVELLQVTGGPAPVLEATSTILTDAKADRDLRIRAAAALGRLATPDAGLDASQLTSAIGALAAESLAADLKAAEQRRFDRRLSSGEGQRGGMGMEGGFPGGPGFGPPGGGFPPPGAGFFSPAEFGIEGQPGLAPAEAETFIPEDPDAVFPLACRRDAWRLHTLAEALAPGSGEGGIAALLEGENARRAADLAAKLRQAAVDLDTTPTEATLTAILTEIGPRVGVAPPAADPPKPAGGDLPQRPGSPFDQPARNDPFGPAG